MDQRGQGAEPRRHKVMVKFDHVGHIGREMPMFGQDLSTLAVSKSEMLLRFGEAPAPLSGGLQAFAIIFRAGDDVDQHTKVMQKASEISFFGIGIADQPCHLAADQRTAQRMAPEGHRVECPLVGCHDPVQAATQKDGFDSL